MPASDAAVLERFPILARTGRRLEALANDRFCTIAFCLLAALQAWLAATHAFWRDEAQALLLAAHAHSFLDLWRDLPYEGHPGLWYVLLRLAVFIDGSARTLGIVQALVGLCTLILIRRFAPFARPIAFFVAANYFVFFEYGVFARSYGLGCLLFFIFLIVRKNWFAWPVLALMANVELHFTLLSAACVVILLFEEKRWSWSGLLVWIAGGAIAAGAALPTADVDLVKMPPDKLIETLYVMASSANLLLPVDPMSGFAWGAPFPLWKLSVGVLTPFAIWQAVGRNRLAGVTSLALLVAVAIATITVYPASPRHIGVVFLCLIGWEWIAAQEGRPAPSRTMVLWLAFSSVLSLCAVASILWTPLTRSHEIAAWIRAHRIEQSVWAAEPPWYGVDLAASLNRPVYNLHTRCLAWFEKWRVGARMVLTPEERGASLAAAAAASGGRAYFMTESSIEVRMPVGASLARLQTFPQSATEGEIALYEIDAPPTEAASLPACDSSPPDQAHE